MKNFNEIVKLLDAGFTRDEILAMEEEPAQAADPAQPEPAAEPSAPAENAVMQAVNDMLAKMDRKLTELQAANIYNQQMPTEQPHAMTDVEALEELIRPHTRDN